MHEPQDVTTDSAEDNRRLCELPVGVMLAEAPVSPVLGMTAGQAVTLLRHDLGITMRELSSVLETDPRNIDRWVETEATPQRAAKVRLYQFLQFRKHLEDTFTSWDAAQKWLNAPNRYLGLMSPMDALRAGRLDVAHTALFAMDSGVYS